MELALTTTVAELRATGATLESALAAAQALAAETAVYVRRLEDELVRQGLTEAEIADAREGRPVRRAGRRGTSTMTAENFIQHHGHDRAVTVIALFQRGASAAEVGRVFGVSRESARHWRDALLCRETRWLPHPDVSAIADEQPALRLVVG